MELLADAVKDRLRSPGTEADIHGGCDIMGEEPRVSTSWDLSTSLCFSCHCPVIPCGRFCRRGNHHSEMNIPPFPSSPGCHRSALRAKKGAEVMGSILRFKFGIIGDELVELRHG